MTKIYAVAMQKGGVGKTTSVVSLAAFLACHDFRVLVVDLDPQANATSNFGFDKHKIHPSIYDLLLEGVDYQDVAVEHEESRVSLLPKP